MTLFINYIPSKKSKTAFLSLVFSSFVTTTAFSAEQCEKYSEIYKASYDAYVKACPLPFESSWSQQQMRDAQRKSTEKHIEIYNTWGLEKAIVKIQSEIAFRLYPETEASNLIKYLKSHDAYRQESNQRYTERTAAEAAKPSDNSWGGGYIREPLSSSKKPENSTKLSNGDASYAEFKSYSPTYDDKSNFQNSSTMRCIEIYNKQGLKDALQRIDKLVWGNHYSIDKATCLKDYLKKKALASGGDASYDEFLSSKNYDDRNDSHNGITRDSIDLYNRNGLAPALHRIEMSLLGSRYDSQKATCLRDYLREKAQASAQSSQNNHESSNKASFDEFNKSEHFQSENYNKYPQLREWAKKYIDTYNKSGLDFALDHMKKARDYYGVYKESAPALEEYLTEKAQAAAQSAPEEPKSNKANKASYAEFLSCAPTYDSKINFTAVTSIECYNNYGLSRALEHIDKLVSTGKSISLQNANSLKKYLQEKAQTAPQSVSVEASKSNQGSYSASYNEFLSCTPTYQYKDLFEMSFTTTCIDLYNRKGLEHALQYIERLVSIDHYTPKNFALLKKYLEEKDQAAAQSAPEAPKSNQANNFASFDEFLSLFPSRSNCRSGWQDEQTKNYIDIYNDKGLIPALQQMTIGTEYSGYDHTNATSLKDYLNKKAQAAAQSSQNNHELSKSPLFTIEEKKPLGYAPPSTLHASTLRNLPVREEQKREDPFESNFTSEEEYDPDILKAMRLSLLDIKPNYDKNYSQRSAAGAAPRQQQQPFVHDEDDSDLAEAIRLSMLPVEAERGASNLNQMINMASFEEFSSWYPLPHITGNAFQNDITKKCIHIYNKNGLESALQTIEKMYDVRLYTHAPAHSLKKYLQEKSKTDAGALLQQQQQPFVNEVVDPDLAKILEESRRQYEEEQNARAEALREADLIEKILEESRRQHEEDLKRREEEEKKALELNHHHMIQNYMTENPTLARDKVMEWALTRDFKLEGTVRKLTKEEFHEAYDTIFQSKYSTLIERVSAIMKDLPQENKYDVDTVFGSFSVDKVFVNPITREMDIILTNNGGEDTNFSKRDVELVIQELKEQALMLNSHHMIRKYMTEEPTLGREEIMQWALTRDFDLEGTIRKLTEDEFHDAYDTVFEDKYDVLMQQVAIIMQDLPKDSKCNASSVRSRITDKSVTLRDVELVILKILQG